MTYPKVTIEEIIDGPRPVRSRSLSRVAAVGTSKKGKYGQFILIGSDDDLDNKIGRSLDDGSVGLQTAMDEGATDLGFVRVMGAARKASASFNVSGLGANDTDKVVLLIKDAEGVDRTYEVSVATGQTALQLASELAGKVNDDATSPVVAKLDASIDGNVLLMAKQAGSAGNEIKYSITDTPDDGFTFTGASANLQSLLGGFDGPKAAEAAIGELHLVAAFEGVEGNNIAYKIIPGQRPGTIQLDLTDGVKKESYLLQITPDELINGNEIAKLRASNMVRGYFTGNIAAPALPTTGTGNLAGGFDGPPPTEDDYIEAIGIMGKNQANIIFAPNQYKDAIRMALLAQAENSTILGGLRVAVLNAPPGLDPNSASAATEGYNTNTGSAVMVAGWATYASQPRLAELSVSPDGFYAGHLAATPTHVSPAARSSSPYFKTIVAVDTESSDQAFELYTNARLEAIVLDPATGGYHCLNGRTLSSDSAEYYVCVRRMANQIKTDIYFASQALKSEPKSSALLASISDMVNGYLKGLANVGKINDGGMESIQKTATGIRADFRWSPVYPADEIDYGMHRLAVDV